MKYWCTGCKRPCHGVFCAQQMFDGNRVTCKKCYLLRRSNPPNSKGEYTEQTVCCSGDYCDETMRRNSNTGFQCIYCGGLCHGGACCGQSFGGKRVECNNCCINGSPTVGPRCCSKDQCDEKMRKLFRCNNMSLAKDGKKCIACKELCHGLCCGQSCGNIFKCNYCYLSGSSTVGPRCCSQDLCDEKMRELFGSYNMSLAKDGVECFACKQLCHGYSCGHSLAGNIFECNNCYLNGSSMLGPRCCSQDLCKEEMRQLFRNSNKSLAKDGVECYSCQRLCHGGSCVNRWTIRNSVLCTFCFALKGSPLKKGWSPLTPKGNNGNGGQNQGPNNPGNSNGSQKDGDGNRNRSPNRSGNGLEDATTGTTHSSNGKKKKVDPPTNHSSQDEENHASQNDDKPPASGNRQHSIVRRRFQSSSTMIWDCRGKAAMATHNPKTCQSKLMRGRLVLVYRYSGNKVHYQYGFIYTSGEAAMASFLAFLDMIEKHLDENTSDPVRRLEFGWNLYCMNFLYAHRAEHEANLMRAPSPDAENQSHQKYCQNDFRSIFKTQNDTPVRNNLLIEPLGGGKYHPNTPEGQKILAKLIASRKEDQEN